MQQTLSKLDSCPKGDGYSNIKIKWTSISHIGLSQKSWHIFATKTIEIIRYDFSDSPIHDKGILSLRPYRRVTETISSPLQIPMDYEVYSITISANCLETFKAPLETEVRLQSKISKTEASSLDQQFPTPAAFQNSLLS